MVAALALAGCGEGGERAAEKAREDRADAAVRSVAERYCDAFRERRLAAACDVVADQTLDSKLIVGANVAGGGEPEGVEPPAPATGCALVRQRRRGWSEMLPRSRWRVDAVFLDAALQRARVDTSAEGTYWMRRTGGEWRIVGFGWLTDASIRALGGEWAPRAVTEE